jgi:uncharacterized repeat protein (TIGR04138 family)
MERKDDKTLEQIALEHKRYNVEAYRFLFETLDHMLGKRKERRHVSGAELSLGVRDFAIERFGFLAHTVFDQWGVHKTDDLGEMVYHLIDAGLMSKTDEDKQSDFNGIYDFHEAFDGAFVRPPRTDEKQTHPKA